MAVACHASAAVLRSVEGRWVTYESGGTVLPAYMASVFGDAKRTLIVILPDESGLDADVQGLARDLARNGFVVVALDTAARPVTSRDERMSETRVQQLQRDIWAAQQQLSGRDPEVDPIALIGCGAGGYDALRLAVSEPLKVAGVVTLDTPIESPSTSRADPRPDLITKLARLTAPVVFHLATANPQLPARQIEWLTAFVAIDPANRALFTYADAQRGFYLPSAVSYDAGYAELARQRWRQFLTQRFE